MLKRSFERFWNLHVFQNAKMGLRFCHSQENIHNPPLVICTWNKSASVCRISFSMHSTVYTNLFFCFVLVPSSSQDQVSNFSHSLGNSFLILLMKIELTLGKEGWGLGEKYAPAADDLCKIR